MKKTLKIISTNWIHLVGFYFTTYISIILFKLIGIEDSASDDWVNILFLSFPMILLLFLMYGIPIILGFYIAIVFLDTIGFNFLNLSTRLILLLEWLIIIPPFISWAFEYDYWLWITLSLSFLITQLLREKKVKQLVGPKNPDSN